MGMGRTLAFLVTLMALLPGAEGEETPTTNPDDPPLKIQVAIVPDIIEAGDFAAIRITVTNVSTRPLIVPMQRFGFDMLICDRNQPLVVDVRNEQGRALAYPVCKVSAVGGCFSFDILPPGERTCVQYDLKAFLSHGVPQGEYTFKISYKFPPWTVSHEASVTILPRTPAAQAAERMYGEAMRHQHLKRTEFLEILRTLQKEYPKTVLAARAAEDEGDILFSQGRTKEAVELWEALVKKYGPRAPALQWRLAYGLEVLGRLEDARALALRIEGREAQKLVRRLEEKITWRASTRPAASKAGP